jgi:hypothetical protein
MAKPIILRLQDIDRGDPRTNPDDPRYRFRFLAEGDSWFTLGGLPVTSLIRALDLPGDAIIVSIANPGDPLRDIADIANNHGLVQQTAQRFGSNWDAILFSGGGNDVIDYAKDLVLAPAQRAGKAINDPADYVDLGRLDTVLSYLKEGYRRIVAVRDRGDSSCRDVPLVTHNYDRVTPRAAPTFVLGVRKGPWLQPVLSAAQIPPEDWIPLSDFLLGALARTLDELAAELPNFYVAPTLGTLDRAAPNTTGVSFDWQNEIHPNGGGYEKLSLKLETTLLGALGV